MSYTGMVDRPLVNVMCVHRHNDVTHDLVDGECKLVEIASLSAITSPNVGWHGTKVAKFLSISI